MDNSQPDPSSDPIRDDEPELDLYTIPSQSRWFLWDQIHETEKLALKEFFDRSSVTRTPKIYKEYRDFMINKYREEPLRKLTFTEIRKFLVGDVNLLRKVFLFLEKSGLINFGASLGDDKSVEDGESSKVRIEEAVPNGVRVGAGPNSVKPILASLTVGDNGGVAEGVPKLPPLASYSDVFSDLIKKKKGLLCGSCGDHCRSEYYEHSKGEYVLCVNCFKSRNYGEEKSMEDFKLSEGNEKIGSQGTIWTDAETLLLLESVLKHGDDWELVAHTVQTKSKFDCILRLIELPFGEFMLGSIYQRDNFHGTNHKIDGANQAPPPSADHQEDVKTEDQFHEKPNENRDIEHQGPLKRQRVETISNASSSLMKQVALISAKVGPHVMAAAANAAVTAIGEENLYSEDIFKGQDGSLSNGLWSSSTNYETERDQCVEDSEMKERHTQSGSEETSLSHDVPIMLRIRAAIATALGGAAAHSKMLADQEEREIEHLVATVIETQMKKLQYKMKYIEDLEQIMEKEYSEMEELEDSLLSDRIDVLQTAFHLGVPRWRGHSSVMRS